MQCAPADSPLARSLEPAVAGQLDTQLLRSIEYSLRWLSWAKTEDGKRNRNRPEWVRFPWETPAKGDGFRGDSMDLDEAADWLGWTDLVAEENRRRADSGLPLIGGHAGELIP